MSKALERVARLERFNESTESTHDRIDAEAGVIYGVKVLGKQSRNGRTYSGKALDSAAKLYEGMRINIDHRSPSEAAKRGVLDRFGVLRNSTRKDEGVYADLHYLKSHPGAPMILESIQRGMAIGLSHDAEGPLDKKNRVVEDLTHVYSVDLVERPATNATLFEEEEAKPMARKIKECLEANASKDPRAKRLLEMDPLEAPPMDAEMSMEPVAEEPDATEEVNAALASLVVAVLSEDLGVEEKITKIGDILRAAEGATAGDGEGGDAVQESLQVLTKQVARIARGQAIRESLDKIGASQSRLTEEQRKLLDEAKSDDAAQRLIESWADVLTEKPRPSGVRSARLLEQQSEDGYEATASQWMSKKK